jgi:4-nitrophenyl phosphatase
MFEKIKCFILDMDGTIYLGNELFPFTKDFLKKVEETGREYYFFTNNSSKSQRAYIEKLGKLGIPIKKDQMMISSHVIIKYLKEHYDGKSIYVLGTPSLIQEFQYFDMNLTDEDPDIVVLGFDTTLTYEKLPKHVIISEMAVHTLESIQTGTARWKVEHLFQTVVPWQN